MTSRQLPILKTLLIRFFIAHSQGLKKFAFRFSQGVGISGEGRDSGLFNRGRGDRSIFSVMDLLGCLGAVRVLLGSSGGSAVLSIMANLSAFEAMFFSHAFGILWWDQLLEFNKVNLHGIWVMRQARG